jgi:hypothetical protein
MQHIDIWHYGLDCHQFNGGLCWWSEIFIFIFWASTHEPNVPNKLQQQTIEKESHCGPKMCFFIKGDADSQPIDQRTNRNIYIHDMHSVGDGFWFLINRQCRKAESPDWTSNSTSVELGNVLGGTSGLGKFVASRAYYHIWACATGASPWCHYANEGRSMASAISGDGICVKSDPNFFFSPS